ncbi:MAG: aldehyde dehydrogenase family protein [Nitrososphaerota archaeon]|nr:aldehyde dehydrogenase family protein [Nitrososphaerota archaeon]MDG7012740.1 aldehyde dehydrogenase family protein [Nitrososphaerota archaeon]MDG7026010.1 aldehyde dehydrogenase family protein [Nitrososphaerota archaeon]
MRSYQELADRWVRGSGGSLNDVDPADPDHVMARVRLSTKEDARAAVEAARSKSAGWGGIPPPRRGGILMKAGELMESAAEELSELLTYEEGKTLPESRAEVARTCALFKFYGAIAYKFGGVALPSSDPNTRIFTAKVPLGVVAVITPWNFPASIPAWKLAPALAAGNAVVFKPATKTPLTGAKMLEALEKAGLPPGVLNMVVGRGGEVGDTIVAHEAVRAVSLTGSTAVGAHVGKVLASKDEMTRMQLELGGKNALVVDSDADLALAADLAVRGAFGLTGQSCTATSRLIVLEKAAGGLKERLLERLKAWKAGPGTQPGVNMGPVVDPDQYRKDLDYIESGKSEGGKLIHGGGATPPGLLIEPTVFDAISPGMRIFDEEVFGPVLSLTEAATFDEALELVNSVGYGHTAGIVSNDNRRINQFIDGAQAGVVKVNKPTVGLELQAPFGGLKKSGAGTWKEMGEGALEFYSTEKTVYLGY